MAVLLPRRKQQTIENRLPSATANSTAIRCHQGFGDLAQNDSSRSGELRLDSVVFETFVLQGSPIALICLTLGNELVVPAVKFIFTCQIVGSTLLCKASKTRTTLAVSSTAVQPQSKGRPKNDAIQTRLKKNFTHSRRASQCLQVCQSDIEKCYNVQQKWKKKKLKLPSPDHA